jgi:hypothetical protein
MTVSAIRGRIARRVLINLRIKPEFVQPLLPAQLRPRIIDGWAIGGICLIRLEQLRLPLAPAACGLASENFAVRFSCVETAGTRAEANVVYVARRETNSWINKLAGATCFPAELNHGEFIVVDTGDRVEINIKSWDGENDLHTAVETAEEVAAGSVFKTVEQLSSFFEQAPLGYSPRRGKDRLDAVRLQANSWSGQPLAVRQLESTYFSNSSRFPAGSVEVDSAFMMRDIEHTWIRESQEDCCQCVPGLRA